MYSGGNECTAVGVYSGGSVQWWECTVVTVYSDGSVQRWECTVVGMYSGGNECTAEGWELIYSCGN